MPIPVATWTTRWDTLKVDGFEELIVRTSTDELVRIKVNTRAVPQSVTPLSTTQTLYVTYTYERMSRSQIDELTAQERAKIAEAEAELLAEKTKVNTELARLELYIRP